MKYIACICTLIFSILFCHAQSENYHSAFREDFSDTTLKNFRYGSTGTKSSFKWKTGVKSEVEKDTDILLFKLDPSDSAGAGRGPEIISHKLTHFGTYSSRLKVPDVRSVQPNVGAVVGYFTYHVDSIEGLSEIDFEWLIADPTVIYVGTWTGHNGKLKRIGRTLNLAKGIIYNTAFREGHKGENTPLTDEQNMPDTITAIPGYDASARFYTYGFDWQADRITWWIIHPETKQKIVLWDYRGSKVGIPTNPSKYRMNFWHTNEWSVHTNPLSIEKPKQPYQLEVDWMLYEPAKK